MELRVLQYFLAVTREQSISGAAESLHLSQPTLSRQLKEMEEELGKQLFIRGSRKVTLTEEGMILRKRAEEIMELVKKAEEEVSSTDEMITGDVSIGAGESEVNHIIGKAACRLQRSYPGIHYHLFSGNAVYVLEQLDRGLIDFGLVYGTIDHAKYESIRLPDSDSHGVLMRKDSPLAKKEFLTLEELLDKPLIISNQEERDNWPILSRVTPNPQNLNIAATYTLIFNGALLVEEGLGYAICFDRLVNTEGTNLCFRPLRPAMEITASIVWKKYQVFTKAAEKFLLTLQELVKEAEKKE